MSCQKITSLAQRISLIVDSTFSKSGFVDELLRKVSRISSYLAVMAACWFMLRALLNIYEFVPDTFVTISAGRVIIGSILLSVVVGRFIDEFSVGKMDVVRCWNCIDCSGLSLRSDCVSLFCALRFTLGDPSLASILRFTTNVKNFRDDERRNWLWQSTHGYHCIII